MVNVKDVQLGTTTRKSFAKINEVMQMPNLIEVQKHSYQWFLDEGLEEVFRDIGSITDYTGNLVLDFIDYTMDEDPKYTIAQCKARDTTYAKPLKVRARLQNKETGEVKENVIYMGDFPLMTDAGTFVINGAERCIVSQLVRSPGVYYNMEHDKTGKELFTNTVIPNRGAWLEYETDANDLFYVRIDKNRKIFITTFLRALGLGTDDEIREFFGDDERIEATIEKDTTKIRKRLFLKFIKNFARANLRHLILHRLTLTVFSLMHTDMTFQRLADISTTKNLQSVTVSQVTNLHSRLFLLWVNSLQMQVN